MAKIQQGTRQTFKTADQPASVRKHDSDASPVRIDPLPPPAGRVRPPTQNQNTGNPADKSAQT